MPVPLERATPALPSLMPLVLVVPVGLIPVINPVGGGMPEVVVGIPVVGVVVLGGVVLVLVEVLVPAWLNTGKQQGYNTKYLKNMLYNMQNTDGRLRSGEEQNKGTYEISTS